MRVEDKQTSRRNFLKQVVKVGAGTALLAASGTASSLDAPLEPVGSSAGNKSRGYRVTPHVRTYYEKAAF